MSNSPLASQGYLLVNKPQGKTAFDLVFALRKKLQIRTIGHAGTLDPLATGVMVMLLGREYTKLSDRFMAQDKEYLARVTLGAAKDTYDAEGKDTFTSSLQPSLEDIKNALGHFQGTIEQIPPMYSAKKIQGKKLYELARQGKTVERKAAIVTVSTELLSYEYPHVDLLISCTKGTYIRSIAHDLGEMLTCGAHLSSLARTKSGSFLLSDCIDGSLLYSQETDLTPYIRHLIP